MRLSTAVKKVYSSNRSMSQTRLASSKISQWQRYPKSSGFSPFCRCFGFLQKYFQG
jgi:hypothetical protein